jgi:hypothetical protein
MENGVGRAVRVYRVCTLLGLGVMNVAYVYIVGGGGILRISDMFRTAGFVLICHLVLCVCNPLPILLSCVEVPFWVSRTEVAVWLLACLINYESERIMTEIFVS